MHHTESSIKVLTSDQVEGEKILVAVSSVSLAAVVTLLMIIFIMVLKATASRKPGNNIFRSHVTAYFLSLLVSDLFQAVGSIMNSKWIQNKVVRSGGFCFAQGMIKQMADVGTAFWITIIAVHTFNVLVLGIHIRQSLMYLVLIGGWSYIGVIVTMGPFFLQEPGNGPFFNISGLWCWISNSYPTEQLVLDYMMMFLAAAMSFVLYLLVFMKLRGNLLVLPNGRLRFQSVDRNQAWRLHQDDETSDLQAHIVFVAKHMLLYPTAYIVLLVPIAACRFAEWMGHDVPLGAVIFSDSVFLLSGFVNALLFVLTGRVLPLREILNMFEPRPSMPKCQAAMPPLRVSVSGEWGSEVGTAYDATNVCAKRLEDWSEKELPQLPEVAHPPHHSMSHGRSFSEVDSFL